jgi:hypothetical protein
MITLDVVYPQLWARNPKEVDENFHVQLGMLKATSCSPQKVGECGKLVPTLLSNYTLDLQTSFFKMTMSHNFQ